MSKGSILATLILTCSIGTCSWAIDQPRAGLSPTDTPNQFNLRYDSTPLKAVLTDVCKHLDVDIVASAANLDVEITCDLSRVELMPAVVSLAAVHGYVFRELVPGCGVYTIRHRTPEEDRAASLRRFFNALREEGFTEDQSILITLRSLHRGEED
jgi:hypothetical protein